MFLSSKVQKNSSETREPQNLVNKSVVKLLCEYMTVHIPLKTISISPYIYTFLSAPISFELLATRAIKNPEIYM